MQFLKKIMSLSLFHWIIVTSLLRFCNKSESDGDINQIAFLFTDITDRSNEEVSRGRSLKW